MEAPNLRQPVHPPLGSLSFRNRLTLFFVAIVIVPMVSVAFVLFRLISDNERGKADARLAARQETARKLFEEDRAKAGRFAAIVGRDEVLGPALRAGNAAAAQRRATSLRADLGLVRIRVATAQGREIVDVGSRDGTAVAERQLVDRGGRRFVLEVSDRSASAYARSVARVTEQAVIVRSGERTLAATIRGAPRKPFPVPVGDVRVAGETYRAASFDAPGFARVETRVSVLADPSETNEAVADSRLLAGALLAGFFILAFTFAVLVSRSLQRQIGSFLDAARRLGRGDFSAQVPTEGRDEFAALGDEFNQMARQLERRLEELGQQRTRLETQLRRIGEAFASNLDRDALLEIAMRTTVDGVAADGGRTVLRPSPGEPPEPRASTGEPGELEPVVRQAENEVLASGQPREVAVDEGSALAHPLRAGALSGDPDGVVTVWRTGRPFASAERELFHYLAGQAGVSLENVELHETVQRQAVTDELTGLANHRRFQEVLASEIERARRFDSTVGLVMLDVDDFKLVNDTYGHQVGDEVLRAVAGVLNDESREIDLPARYGGEELALILPGTDLEGAHQLAERVRRGIEALRFRSDGAEALRVTASFGAASLGPGAGASAHDQSGLIRAADGALYAAKRGGKNRTVAAQPEGARPAQ